MKTIFTISINDVLGGILNTREAVNEVSKLIESSFCDNIELDFSDVYFMSRSFADQFHKEKSKLQQDLKLNIYIINANEDINRILEAVANTQNKSQKANKVIPIYRFSKPELISDYLLSI